MLVDQGAGASMFKRGDPVSVLEDGAAWGDSVTPPKFFIAKFPGVPAAQFAQYFAPDHNGILQRTYTFSLVGANAVSGTGQYTLTQVPTLMTAKASAVGSGPST